MGCLVREKREAVSITYIKYIQQKQTKWKNE